MAQASYDPYQLHSNQFTIMGIPTQDYSLAELKKALAQNSVLTNKKMGWMFIL